jgi:hypothetical protein
MAKFTKAMTAAAMAAVLTASHAMAADSALAPGKPAGVQAAQSKGTSLLLIGGAAIITVIAVVVASQQGNNAQCGSACNAPTTAT